jgi:hypothetical protein
MAPATARAQSELRGRVLSEAGVPVVGATVMLTSIRYAVKTDSLGQFRLAGTPGSTLALAITAPGFRDAAESVVLQRRGFVEREFRLTSEAVSLPAPNPSDQVLAGRVVDAENNGIAYANGVVNGGRRFVTDDSGRFRFPIGLTGPLTLILRRIGYEPTEVKLAERPDTAIAIRMNALARALPGQLVTGRSPFVRLDLGGFYKRMRDAERGAQVGYFVTPEDLAMRNPTQITDAVQQFPNIRIRPIDDGAVDQFGLAHSDGMPLNRKMRIENMQGCPLTVYLDRIRIQPSTISVTSGSKSTPTGFADEEVNSIIQPHAVAGIEVYPRFANSPPEFAIAPGTCGLVLVWTK